MSNIILSTARSFTSRSHGTIGRVAWRIAADGTSELSVNDAAFAPLPAESISHLLNFALQTLQDSYAGATSAKAAIAAFTAKADKLIAGTLGVRGEGSAPVDDATTAARTIMRPVVKAKLAAAYKDADTAERLRMIDAAIAKNAGNAKFRAAVDDEVARMAASRAALAAVTDSMDIAF